MSADRLSKTPHPCRLPQHGANCNRRNVLASVPGGVRRKRVREIHTLQGVSVLTLDGGEHSKCVKDR